MTKTSSLDTLSRSLHKSGRRMTPQRALILQVLDESEFHMDAEDIWDRVRKLDENINLATVYRTLAVLKEIGLVDQRYFARDHKREVYEPTKKPEHYHFTCLQCKRVIEFSTEKINQVRAELQKEINVHLTNACVCFEGYCHRCAEKNTHNTE